MMKTDLSCLNRIAAAMPQIANGGGFLVTGEKDHNIMTIGWATTGVLWYKPVFMAVVRYSRHTHNLLEGWPEFSVSIPAEGEMKQELGICGSKSGRDADKIALCGLTMQSAKEVKPPVVSGCALHVECRAIARADLDLSALDPELAKRYYANGDTHTMYYGEILACYGG